MTASRLARTTGAIAAAVALLAVSCAGGGAGGSSDGGSSDGGSSDGGSSDGGSNGGGSRGAAATSGPTSAAGAATSEVSPPPEPTGVPGLDDDDPFCAAWTTYAATVQVLSIAGSFGSLDPVALAEMELIAVPALRVAVAAMAAALPTALEPEREAFLNDFVGPVARRAARASQFLLGAGLGEGHSEALGAVWLDVLRARDPSQPVPDIDVPEELAAAVASAAAAFSAKVTAFTIDPSLDRTGVVTPLTDAHIASTCPDLTDLGVGDAL